MAIIDEKIIGLRAEEEGEDVDSEAGEDANSTDDDEDDDDENLEY